LAWEKENRLGNEHKEPALATHELGRCVSEPETLAGLYVHVPFCSSTCDFCAFYQVQPDAEKIARYLEAVECETGLVDWSGRPVGTVFWGGGTPGLLSPGQLERLGTAVRRVPLSPRVEWTVELAPASVTPARLRVLRDLGVTRVSIGVQSLRPSLLDALGRLHTREQALLAYERARVAGFASVNLDLMFALPGQTEEDWLSDLDEVIGLAPDHVSTYCLTFEEDTALWVRLAQGKVKLDPEREAKLYERTWSHLAAAGYAQYEVSNFARPGHVCVHNLNTWRMGEWVGLGPAAASQQDGWRGRNPADLARWSDDVKAGRRAEEERESLTAARLLEDSLIFGLRMNAGVSLARLRARFGSTLRAEDAGDRLWRDVAQRLERLEREGLLRRYDEQVCLTDRGRLLADAVGSEFLGLAETGDVAPSRPRAAVVGGGALEDVRG
jgi:oxygen-independent coproporphyrinogen-3 oxidase